MAGDNAVTVEIPGQVDPTPKAGASEDGEICKVDGTENGVSEDGGGVGEAGFDGRKGAVSQKIGGRQLPPMAQEPAHKSAGNLNASAYDDITRDPSIPDLLAKVGKFGVTERRSSRECLSPLPTLLRDQGRRPHE